MGVSKVIYGGNTLIDLTADTVVSDKLLTPYTAHGADGEAIVGSCTFDADTQDATAIASEILATKVAYIRSARVEGSMPNNGGITGYISTVDGEYTVPIGYHDGSGKVSIDATEQEKLVPRNIRQGIEVLGITGTMNPVEEVLVQAKSVVPATTEQVVVADTNYDYLTQVTVSAIPYTETENAAGGITVTIAG